MTIMDCRPFLAVGVSFLAAVLISFSRRYPNVRESWSVIASFIKFGLIISMVPGVLAGVTYEWTLFQITDTIGFTLRADSAGILFACLAALLWIPINFYSIGYMRCNNEHEQTGYFAAFAICMSSVMGIAMASNLLTFFFFYELLTIASYPLVLHKRNEEALLASRKYLIYTLISGQLFLAGLVAVYCISGTMDFKAGGFLTTDMAPTWQLQLIFLIMILAGSVKAAVMPLHGWLPDAHSQAPTAGSVDLAGILLKTAAYGLLRFSLPLFPNASAEFAPIAMWLGVIGIFYGAWMAFAQTDIKRLIAYTSVSHMGFVLIAIYTGSQLAYQGAVIQMIAHGLSAAGLFILCGQLYERIHTRDMRMMGGLWSKMKWLPALSLFFAVATLGMPGTGNFVGEFMILFGSFQVVPVITVISTFGLVFASVYSLAMLHRAYFGKAKSQIASQELPGMSLRELFMILLLVVLLVLLGFYPQPILDTSHSAMSNIQQWFVNSVTTTRP